MRHAPHLSSNDAPENWRQARITRSDRNRPSVAVVDQALRVRGIEYPRIADASVMSAITSGNTNSPTITITEKAADMIVKSGRA
jgi:choline dehydrogenase-like flavoprotein